MFENESVGCGAERVPIGWREFKRHWLAEFKRHWLAGVQTSLIGGEGCKVLKSSVVGFNLQVDVSRDSSITG
jgi:hypothetical protein